MSAAPHDANAPSKAGRSSPSENKRPIEQAVLLVLSLSFGCKECNHPPGPCPPLSVVREGEAIVFDDAKARYDPEHGTFEVSLLRDNPIPCEDIVSGIRHFGRERSEATLELLVRSTPELGIGQLSVLGHSTAQRAFHVDDGRARDGTIAICIPHATTLRPREGTFVVQGLAIGQYCGEKPPPRPVGMLPEDDCPALELHDDGRPVPTPRALAFGEPGESLEVMVFPGGTEVTCEQLAEAERPIVTIVADDESGSLRGAGWVKGSRDARPVRYGSEVGDRIAVCVPDRVEWEEGSIEGLVRGRYCGRDPRPSIWDAEP